MKKEFNMIHSVAVADLMYKIALHFSGNELYAQKMFALGLLHDIGKTLTDKQERHASVGGNHMRKYGYPYWTEIACHGEPFVDYESTELELLNRADMCINQDGVRVTPAERVADIAIRYGENSVQHLTSAALLLKLYTLDTECNKYWIKLFEESEDTKCTLDIADCLTKTILDF